MLSKCKLLPFFHVSKSHEIWPRFASMFRLTGHSPLCHASPDNSPLYPKEGWCLCPSPVDTGCPSRALITTSVPPCCSLYTYFTQQFGFILSTSVTDAVGGAGNTTVKTNQARLLADIHPHSSNKAPSLLSGQQG